MATLGESFFAFGALLGSPGWFGVEPEQLGRPYGSVAGEHGAEHGTESRGQRLPAFRLLPSFTALAGSQPEAPSPVKSPVAFVWETSDGPGLPFDDPTALTVSPDGKLWVPDGSNSRFQLFTLDGEFVESWGSPGSGEGEFDFHLGGAGHGAVAWDAAGNIYVADSGNFRIQTFAPDRRFLVSWGGHGDGDGQFQAVNNLAIDRDNRIYAIDYERHDIQIFDDEGAFLGVWGEQGIGDGELLHPGGAAFGADGNLYVSDARNYRVQTFAPDGRPLGS